MKKQIPTNYEKVGRITMPVARAAHVKAGDIMINQNHKIHIAGTHKKELAKVGMTASDFVKMVIENYTRIYKDSETNALILVVYNEKISNSAVIELNYEATKEFWEIKTASPYRNTFFKNKLLVWGKGAHPLK